MDELDSSTSSHESQSANAVVEGLLRLSVANFMRGKPLQAGIITTKNAGSNAEEGKHAPASKSAEKTPASISSSSSTADTGTNDSSRLSSSFIVSPVQHPRSSTARGSSGTTTTTGNSANKENEDRSTSAGLPTAPTVSVCDAPVRDMQEDTEGSKGNEELFQKSLNELMEEKATLKKRLRQYDISFQAKYGREPEKVDKEPIRHLYQRYHDYKKAISAKQAQEGPGKASPGRSKGEKDKNQGGIQTPAESSVLSGNKENDSRYHSEDNNTSESYESSSTTNNAASPGTINDLKKEKRELQIKLREYEDNFMAQHGRKVRYHRDIIPVAAEYKRYKEIKNALRIEK